MSPSPSGDEDSAVSESHRDPDDSDDSLSSRGPSVKRKKGDGDKGSRALWNSKQIANLRKSFRCLANIDDILRHLTWKDTGCEDEIRTNLATFKLKVSNEM